ncbi:putative HSP20-like chaperone [Lupinus albus]|uniref:Putative HSP20-like chaperone n=1 Tax=Lupinus albus TaxID=3870 RepID=A0A6A4PAN7_LUPAL|nr:putative HSP20-like chaperone [Lupinus albus]
MDSKEKLHYTRRSSITLKPMISDCKFLIDFIITTYLGPDLKSHNPKCSILQRLISASSPYNLTHLGPSYVSISLLEKLYYYLLKDSSPDLILSLDMLHLYVKGKLSLQDSDFTHDSLQFTSFFPLDLHQQIWYPHSFRIVKGVLLIDDPVLTCFKQEEDLNRFKSLTGFSTFKLNLNECLAFQIHHLLSNDINKVPEAIPNGRCPSEQFQHVHKTKYSADDNPKIQEFPRVVPTKDKAMGDCSKPTMMPLLSVPDIDTCDKDHSLVLTGTARRGLFGPSVGVVDIGISEAAYLFRVSLPGVKKVSNHFSCEIESDGRVEIRGLLGGGRSIMKQSRFFEMKIRQLCSPGPFTLSFSLPGPVDPRLFAPNFRSDGIFEGVVIKH